VGIVSRDWCPHFGHVSVDSSEMTATFSLRSLAPKDSPHSRWISSNARGKSREAVLLQLNDGRSCSAARKVAERRLAEIEDRLRDLSTLREQLRGLVRRCRTERGTVHCPLIDALNEN